MAPGPTNTPAAAVFLGAALSTIAPAPTWNAALPNAASTLAVGGETNSTATATASMANPASSVPR